MRQILIAAALLLAALALGAYLHGQDKPVLPEVSQLRLLATYEKAMLAQQAFQQAQANLNAAAKTFNDLAESERKAAGYPDGTRFNVNVDAQTVTAILPAKPSPKLDKPEVKK